MKSPMMTANPELAAVDPNEFFSSEAVSGFYSDLRVLQSAAGFYIGTLFQEFDRDGNVVMEEPGSRDSGYFATKEEAERELVQMEGGDLSEVRWHP